MIGTREQANVKAPVPQNEPLGFLAPVMFITKQLLRDAWETSTTWDETLDRSIIKCWEELHLSLESLSKNNLQRCYKSTKEKPIATELSFDNMINKVTICTVLRWLNSEHFLYHSYVANKVGYLLETKNANDWRYVPSK